MVAAGVRTQHELVQTKHETSAIDIEDDDLYSEIRESMMVRPVTVYGRKLSIRSSYIDSDDPDDQYRRIELATSLRRPNIDKFTNEYKDYTELIDEPFLEPKNNIYEQLILDELTETQKNSDNATYAEVEEKPHNACSHHKHLNTNERSNKFDFVSEVDNTEDKGDTCTEREMTVNCMQMPVNKSEISDKNDFVTEIQISRDNATYAKVVTNYNNECSSKIHFNTTGIPDKANFATGTDNTEKISENSTESRAHTTDNKGEMTTES
ncbi:unnamed protein product [Mytilus coruscus]|uniref:Uncharacterized protein n=1 Tax=Mytilus coruscus TaxID=42192 RepID=A0A6J8DKH2_MYTCO|nr:unnamed protein product [Mytilus coruscus]